MARDRARGKEPQTDAFGIEPPPSELDTVESMETTPVPRPYISRRSVSDVGSASNPELRPRVQGRPARTFITDYGYVVTEMQRIGLTFGALILLLVIISRFLR